MLTIVFFQKPEDIALRQVILRQLNPSEGIAPNPTATYCFGNTKQRGADELMNKIKTAFESNAGG